jgi:outer membrane protein, heavy metal efflux system
MKVLRRYSIALFIPFILCGQPSVQQNSSDSVLTLQQFLDQVGQHNARLQAANSRVTAVEARVGQARAWDDPQVGVEFYATPVSSLNPFRDGMETDYFIQQMIPFFGKKSLMSDAAAANVKMTEASASTAAQGVRSEAKRAFAMAYAAQRRLGVNSENQRLLKQIIESARAKYSVGQATQGDVLKAQLELAKLENERASLDQELESAAAMMNALRSQPSGTPIGTIAEIELTEISGPVEDLTAQALARRPEIKGMQSEIDMNKADLASAKLERVPDVMVRGMYKRMTIGEDQWAAMFSINIPLAPWASGKYSGKIEENMALVETNESSLREMRNMVQYETRDAFTKTRSQWQQLKRYRETILPQSQQTLQSMLTSYQSGSVDFLSLIDSYRMVQMLRMEYYMLVGEYQSNVAQLEKALGTDFIGKE